MKSLRLEKDKIIEENIIKDVRNFQNNQRNR